MVVWSNRYSYRAPHGCEADLQLLDFGGMTIGVQYLTLAVHRLPGNEDGNCNVMHEYVNKCCNITYSGSPMYKFQVLTQCCCP